VFVWSGQNAGEYAVGHLLETRWQGSQWLTGGLLGPEASWMVFVVIVLMFWIFDRCYRTRNFHAEIPRHVAVNRMTPGLGLLVKHPITLIVRVLSANAWFRQ